MITIDDLNLCAALAREADDLKERIARLRSMATGSRSIPCGPNGGGYSDRIATTVSAIDELERKMLLKIDAYTQHVRYVEEAIDEVPDADQRRMLRLRYVDGLTWEDVSERTHYSERWCKELRRRGLVFLGVWETQHTSARGNVLL